MLDDSLLSSPGEGPEDVQDAAAPADCARVQGVLMEYLGHEMGPRAMAWVGEHLRHCPACRAQAASLAETVVALRASAPVQHMPSELAAWRRKRVLWAGAHPFLAWCVLRHRWISWFAVLAAFVAVALAMRHWRLDRPPPEGIGVEVVPPARAATPGR